MSEQSIIAALEIGTGHVRTVIGLSDENGPILGVGEIPARGIKKGAIVDFEAASQVVHASIAMAEKEAGIELESVYLAQSGSHLKSFYNEATVTVSSSDNTVSEDDIARVIAEAKNKQLPEDRLYIHHIQNPYRLDGAVMTNPLGCRAEKLTVGYWSVHGELALLRNVLHTINGFGIKVKDIIVSSIASGSVVTSEGQKESGCLVLDMGRGSTDVMIYRGGYVVYTSVLPVGGDHITSDLAFAFQLTQSDAEELKRAYFALPAEVIAQGGTVSALGKQSGYPIHEVKQVVDLRMREIFEIVEQQAVEVLGELSFVNHVVLTGGAVQAYGERIASEVFNWPVMLGVPLDCPNEDFLEPQYSTVLGVLRYAQRYYQSQNKPTKAKKWVNRMTGLLKM